MFQRLVIMAISASWVLPVVALDDPTISVNGSAKISVKPDQVVLSASVESRDEKLSTAKDDNDKRIAGVIEFLKAAKVEAKDIQTEIIQIDPVFPRATKSSMPNPFQSKAPQQTADPLKPSGYVVRRGFNIRIRDVQAFEKIYAGLIDQGINRVDGISLQTSELEKLQADARRKAIGSARANAELLAGELGAKLSGVQSIQDATQEFGPVGRTTGFAMSDPFGSLPESPPLAVGEIQVTANVSVVFQLSETDFE